MAFLRSVSAMLICWLRSDERLVKAVPLFTNVLKEFLVLLFIAVKFRRCPSPSLLSVMGVLPWAGTGKMLRS